MKKKVCIASLSFNPSHVAHLVAFGKAFAEIGVDVGYMLHSGYKSFGSFPDIASLSYLGKAEPELLESFTHVLVYNPAVHNPGFTRAMKRRGCKVIYVYHEPSASIAGTWRRLGVRTTARLLISRFFSRRTLQNSDLIVLPSAEAWRNYQKADRRFNGCFLQMPLLFDDAFGALRQPARTTFSYIGTISHAHAFDQFLDFMKYALRENLGIRFLIASRHKVPEHEVIEQHKDSITLRCGRPLTEIEMNECYAQSLCVWNLYRFSTQSGVMANAFMCGAPVIASRTGAFLEFVKDGYNGKFANAADHREIAANFFEIAGAVGCYSKNCRQSFAENFHYRSQLGMLERILSQSP